MSSPEKAHCCGAPPRATTTAATMERHDDGIGQSDRPATDTVSIPGGQGLLGTDRPELAIDGEAPLRTTRIKPFRMDATTVTNARFKEFVDDTNYTTDAERLGDSFVFEALVRPGTPCEVKVVAVPWWRPIKGPTGAASMAPEARMPGTRITRWFM